jgi:hypothetical protein
MSMNRIMILQHCLMNTASGACRLNLHVIRCWRLFAALIFIGIYSGMWIPAVEAAESRSELPDEVMQANTVISGAILNGDYPAAESVAREFARTHLEEPAGPLFLASVFQYVAVDYDDFSRNTEFESNIKKTIVLAGKRLKQNPGDRWALYYHASANGLLGSWASLTGQVLTGVVKGRSGAVSMSSIIEADSAFADAYLFAGSYHFWKSVATARISWLPFIGDEQEQGIREVEYAITHGSLTGPLANTVLLEMLLERDPQRALVLATDLLNRYPHCRLFAWQRGEALKKLGRFAEAQTVFEAIALSMKNDPGDNGSGELRCWWKLAGMAADSGDCETASRYCRLVIERGKDPAVGNRQRERIKQAATLLKECRNER